MPQPYNYGVGLDPLPDPTRNFLQGIQMMQQFEQQKAAQEQATQRKEIFTNLMNLGTDATADDIVKASLALPQDAELFRKNWDIMEDSSKDAMFNAGAAAFIAPPDQMQGVLEEWAEAADNSGDKQFADQLRTAAKIAEHDPQAAKTTIGTILAFADGERFKNAVQPSEATTFQKDFQFVKDTFGDDAAGEFAQYGRGGVVSIPLGNGQTYVGPAASAPGAARWQAKDAAAAPDQGAGAILNRASQTKTITAGEADVIRRSMGPKGGAQFDKWLKDQGISIAQTVDGQTYYLVNGKWFDNPEGR